jgi:hypothetical protein
VASGGCKVITGMNKVSHIVLCRTLLLSAGLAGVLSLAGSGMALAQRLPDPPAPVEQPVGPFRIPNLEQFLQSYKQAGSPKLLVSTEVFGVSGDAAKTLNNQAIATRLSARLQDAFRNAEVFFVSPGADQLRRASNENQLTRTEDFAAARAVGTQASADIVFYLRLIEQSGRQDGVRYSGSYVIADLRRGQSIGSFAWDMYQDPASGEFDAYRMADYAAVLATRMSYDFVDAFPLGGAVAGLRSFNIQLVGDYADEDLKGFRDALRTLPGVKGESVKLDREDATSAQKISTFNLFYGGDLIDLRSDLRKAAIDQLFMEASIASTAEGNVSVKLSPLGLTPRERNLSGGPTSDRARSDRDGLAASYAKAGSPLIALMVNRISVSSEAITGSPVATLPATPTSTGTPTGTYEAPQIIVGNRVDLTRSGSLEDLIVRGLDSELTDRRAARREDGLLDVGYFEAKLAQRMIQLKLNLVDVSAAQSKVLSSPASMSQPWTDQTLATELAKQSGAKVAITGVGKLVRDPATGNPTRVTFTLRAFDTQSATLLGATSVYRDLNSGSLTFNQSIDELVAEATGRIVGQLSDAWGR